MDASSFAKYIADCQLETTMSFNDYYATMPSTLPAWPSGIDKWGVIASGATAPGLVATLILLVAVAVRPGVARGGALRRAR